MRFRMLGSLEVQTGADWTSIGAPKWRAVLARLLLASGQIVPTDTLIDEVWGDAPPARASNMISIYVLRLRRFIGDHEGKLLRTQSPGYQLRIGPGDLDTQRFTMLLRQGQQALSGHDPEAASQLLTEAEELWRGSALADVPPSPFVEAEANRLNELRQSAAELRLEAGVASGQYRDAIPELRRLLADQPLKEELWLLLLRALDGAGRRAEALAAYDQARTVLSDQLGVDPGPELRDLFARLLRDEPLNAAPAAPTTRSPTSGPPAAAPPVPPARRATDRSRRPPPAAVVPPPRPEADTSEQDRGRDRAGRAPAAAGSDGAAAGTSGSIALGRIDTGVTAEQAPAEPDPGAPHPMQLPADIVDFTGRDLHVQHVCDLLSPGDAEDNPGAVPVALVAGAGGLGKTTLAIHAAHRLRTKYPDGQLYVDLQGATGQPLTPAEVLARFLRDLGVDGAQIPASEEERAAQYRTRLNGRRMLILLDSARDAAQVRPLLPGTAACAVIVTSRSRLPDLVGGGLVHLEVLDDAEALTMFSRIVGAPRAAAEPDATAEVLVACAGLPLAIRICAARLAARRSWSIQSLAARLHDEHRRLDELKVGDLAVRASFEVSFASLPGPLTPDGIAPARAFRMLGLWHGSSIALSAAAALLGEDEDPAADVLEFLVDAHLLESSAPDCYSFHDLLRVYAAERAALEEPDAVRREAIQRITAWYLHTGSAADHVVAPQRERVELEPLAPGCQPLTFRDIGDGLAWCQRERANILTATRQAADYGLHAIAWKIPVAVLGCFNTLSFRNEWLTAHLIALDSARQAGDRHGEAWVLNNLGMVSIQQHMDAAIDYFEQAQTISQEIGDQSGEAQAANNLADAYLRLGRPEEALDPLKRALALYVEAEHRYGEGIALNNMGEVYLDLGQLDEAIDSIQAARRIFTEVKTLRGEGYAAHNLGRAYLGLGRSDEAAAFFGQALDIRQRSGDRHSQAVTLLFLGRAQRRIGRVENARQSWTDALSIFIELGDEDEENAVQIRSELAAM
ncbi:MAG TPA: BTAD domain-containing putative transcriptional regulator [Streptosporangiaceae bacterium]|jgi:DNA-binding SARP family transcriptional activator/predicted negative regulator of RcsB-dependent stress response|nr:BTAD domain-containing putative transcriptional regulator [Streptosporangiaceae bacterium]